MSISGSNPELITQNNLVAAIRRQVQELERLAETSGARGLLLGQAQRMQALADELEKYTQRRET